MDTRQNEIFDELEVLHFDFIMERLEKLCKDASQCNNFGFYLTVKNFMERQHIKIKELKNSNRELTEQLEKNMEYHNVVIGTYSEAQICSIIEELKSLVENYNENNLHNDICPKELNTIVTSHKLIETLFEENKILKNNCKKYKQTMNKQADKISVLHQSNKMYETFLKFQKGTNFLAVILALIAVVLGSAAFWSTMR